MRWTWLVEQDDARVVALYIEGLDHAERLLPIAERARSRGVRIILLKAGRSDLGQSATASHTGKIASSYAVYADVLRQAGVVALNSLAEFLAAVEVLSFMPYPRASGDPKGGVSLVSSSGGASALLADHSSERGVPMAELGEKTSARLDELLPGFARKENPIDVTGQINAITDLFRNTCLALAADPRTEALVVQHANSGRRWLKDDGDVYKQIAREMPVIVSFSGTSCRRRRARNSATPAFSFRRSLRQRWKRLACCTSCAAINRCRRCRCARRGLRVRPRKGGGRRWLSARRRARHRRSG